MAYVPSTRNIQLLLTNIDLLRTLDDHGRHVSPQISELPQGTHEDPVESIRHGSRLLDGLKCVILHSSQPFPNVQTFNRAVFLRPAMLPDQKMLVVLMMPEGPLQVGLLL